MPKLRWTMIFMGCAANAINYIDRANLAVAAPGIRTEFGISPVVMGVILGAFFWTYALMQLPAGWFIDRLGVRISLAFAVTWWSLFTIATGAARGVTQFIGARLMLGVGEAFSLPSFTRVAFNWFPRSERGMACGIFNSGSTTDHLTNDNTPTLNGTAETGAIIINFAVLKAVAA
jgi:MFS family permease